MAVIKRSSRLTTIYVLFTPGTLKIRRKYSIARRSRSSGLNPAKVSRSRDKADGNRDIPAIFGRRLLKRP